MRPFRFLFIVLGALLGGQPSPAKESGVAPDAFVAALYKQHAVKSPFFQADDRALVDAYFAEPLAGLLWRDAKESRGEVGAIDFDPLYDSQDPAPKDFVVHPAKISGRTATVVVTFVNFGKKRKIVFDLIADADAWRISDIHWRPGRTMLGVLKAAYAG